MRVVGSFLMLVLMVSAASADQQAADACKSGLSPIGQQIYAAALAQKPTPATGRDIVTAEVKKLMAEGKVGLLEGRKDGEAAGHCLELLK